MTFIYLPVEVIKLFTTDVVGTSDVGITEL